MTRGTLNTNIDTKLNDNVADGSIKPSDEAILLKQVADYTDQEIIVANALANTKADKVIGKSLVLDTEITRLAGVSNVDISGKVDKVVGERLINASEIVKVSNTSGTNTGDQDLSGKENVSNKSIDGTLLSNSDIKFPSEKAVKTYVDAQQPYKKYVALLSQTGVDAPVVTTLLENTLSGSIVWTRISVGVYNGTLIGAFVNLKTWCMICPISVAADWSLYPIDDNTVQIKSWDNVGNGFVDGSLNETSIEIRVYN